MWKVISPRFKTCFVSAPIAAKTHHIRDILASRGVQVLGFEDVTVGSNFIQSAMELIRRADLFVAVLVSDATAPRTARDNVLIELGIAAGCGKQVLIFAPAKGDVLPSDMHGMLTVRTSLSNRDAIEFALDQVLAAPERRAVSQPSQLSSVEERNLGDRAEELLESYSSVIASQEGFAFERLVADAIRLSGVDVVSESFGGNAPIDLAVWADSLQSTVGNPLLIEVKRRVTDRGDFKKAVEQLARASRNAGATWSLLVYGEGPTAAGRWVSRPTVLAISIRELLEAMKTNSFVDVVRDLRNRRAHDVL